MSDILSVDSVDVLVIVDNATDSLSSNPKHVLPEWAGLLRTGKLPLLSGRATCCAHHGLSLLITAQLGGETHTVLFDAGPEASTFIRNATILGVDFSKVEAVVLSHGHWDHAGGLLAAIKAISEARRTKRVDCFVHPGMFMARAMQRPNGDLLKFEPVPDPDALAKAGANVFSTAEPQVIAGGAFYVSGEIPRLTKYETGFPGHLRLGLDGVSWEPDPLIMDERFISVLVKGKGQVVFSACSHAGVINVLTHAQSVFPSIPLYSVIGGFHLSGGTEKIIPETVGDLKQFGLKLVAPGHCTGWRALSAMAREFGEELVPSAVGKRYLM